MPEYLVKRYDANVVSGHESDEIDGHIQADMNEMAADN